MVEGYPIANLLARSTKITNYSILLGLGLDWCSRFISLEIRERQHGSRSDFPETRYLFYDEVRRMGHIVACLR